MSSTDGDMRTILDWCASIIGPFDALDTDDRFHGRTSVLKLKTPEGNCYLKVHRERNTWDAEVHGYEKWAPAFGEQAPRLLGVHDDEPLALLVAELPGRRMEDEAIAESDLHQAWHDAGIALAQLHDLAIGERFGLCQRDGGAAAGPLVRDAVEYVSTALDRDVKQAEKAGYLNDSELGVVREAQGMVHVFKGEQPIPCHRDYNPANWLIDKADCWIGVIDFEMSAWDVRVAEFSRYPQWEWMLQPELINTFFDGYGRQLTANEQDQLFVAHVQYAISCILWGHEHNYHDFVREARDSLATLGKQS